MVSLLELQPAIEYQCLADLDVYDSPKCDRLSTQVATDRHLTILALPLHLEGNRAIRVRLCEDDYPGWLSVEDAAHLQPAATAYIAPIFSTAEIQAKIPEAIAYAHRAMEKHKYYLWGGTVGPNYDCSGLMQAAFASTGVWLPRDAYQQEAFTQPVSMEALQLGDLIFFGPPKKATHVGLYIGNRRYIHSSGIEQGRNGMGIDRLCADGDKVSQAYYRELRGAGRVMHSYQPQGKAWE